MPRTGLLIILALSACATRAEIRQERATQEAEVFAPGVLSSGNVFRGTFMPEGLEFYFFKHVGDDPDAETYRIFRSLRRDDGTWSAPEIVTLGEPASDLYPVILPGGARMIFASYRDAPGDTSAIRARISGAWNGRTTAGELQCSLGQ